MPILGNFPHNKTTISGYTLLELVVALALMGLLAATVAPRFVTLYESVQFSNEKETIFAELNSLPYQAFMLGSTIELTTYPVKYTKVESNSTIPTIPLHFPENWRLTTAEPILYRANGTCTGGQLSLHYQQSQLDFELSPPFCQL